MGLDNGIEIKKYNDEVFVQFPETWIHTYNKVTYIEPVYMRKWWGVRNDIVGYLNYKYHTNDMDGGRWDLNESDLLSIIDILFDWLDEDKWREYGESIWNWKDDNIAGQIGNHIAAIRKIIKLQEEYSPNILVQFYDSY